MASFNRVLLLGNLTRDPQLRYLPSQTPVVDFGLACNRKYKTQSGEQREEVLFVDCSAFGRQAEVINQYCTKGRPLFIEGHLKYDTWEDKQGGGKRSKLSVVIDNFQLLGGGQGGAGAGAGGGGAGYSDAGDAPPRGRRPGPPRSNRPAPQTEAPAEPPFAEEQNVGEDDIPF